MGHSAAVWDLGASMEVMKDWNGIEQIMLRNPKGASARVRSIPASYLKFVCQIFVTPHLLWLLLLLFFSIEIYRFCLD